MMVRNAAKKDVTKDTNKKKFVEASVSENQTTSSPAVPASPNLSALISTKQCPDITPHSAASVSTIKPPSTSSSSACEDIKQTDKGSHGMSKSSGGKPSQTQRVHEYIQIMTNFPKLCPNDKTKLKTEIENTLNFKQFSEMKISDLNLTKCTPDKTPILDAMSIKTGVSLKFVAPPILQCLECKRNLNVNKTWSFTGKPPTQVKAGLHYKEMKSMQFLLIV